MIRRALLPVAALLVAGQMATTMAAAAAVLRRPGNAQGLADDCRCPQATATSCPMHKAAAKAPPCALRTARPADVAALAWMLGALGVLPSPASAVAPAPAIRLIALARRPASSTPSVPDPPPPRG